MSKTPFRERMYPCGRCSRDVRITSVFYHYRSIHDEALVRAARDGTDACALCGMELPPGDANNGWKLRLRHFRDHHGKRLVDTDAIR